MQSYQFIRGRSGDLEHLNNPPLIQELFVILWFQRFTHPLIVCQLAVMWCLGLACIKGSGFSISSRYLRRCLAAEIKPQLLQKWLPKPLPTSTCELTRLWHPKQTLSAQTGLATATQPRDSPPYNFATESRMSLPDLAGKHVYCHHRMIREKNKKTFPRSSPDGWYSYMRKL